MTRRTRWNVGVLVLVAAVFSTGSCASVEPQPNPYAEDIEAVFDPSASPPMIPIPTDLAKNPQTGLLNVPVAAEAGAQQSFDRYLNSLDGFPTSATAEVMFKGELDESTIVVGEPTDANASIMVVALTQAGAKGVSDVTTSYKTMEVDVDGKKETWSKISIKNKKGWARGTTFGFFVTNKLKSKAGKGMRRSILFELAASAKPLCVWDEVKSHCTYNHSTLLATQVRHAVEEATKDSGKTHAEIEQLIDQTTLSKATDFERLRRGYDVAFQAASAWGLNRENVVVSWAFTTVGLTEIAFDPSAGIVPGPGNDVILGRLPETDELNKALNTLSGFSTQATYFAIALGGLDPESLKGGSLLVVNVDKVKLLQADIDYTAEYDDKASVIKVIPKKPFDEKSQYAVALLSKFKEGDVASQGGLKDPKGRRLIPSPILALAKSAYPLIKDAKCTDPNTPSDKRPPCESAVSLLTGDQAAQLEQLRLNYSKLLVALPLFSPGAKPEDLVGAWTFKTQSITEPMTHLRTLPYMNLGSGDQHGDTGDQGKANKVISGTPSGNFTNYPTGFSKDNLALWVPNGSFRTWNYLNPQTGVFYLGGALPSGIPTPGKVENVPFVMMVPKGGTPSAGWPLIMLQHGLFHSKRDAFHVADELAAAGFAIIAFDTIYHGDRTQCLKDDECNTGGTCNVQTGQCSNGFRDSDGDGDYDASGAGKFVNVANPLAIRDNLRQGVIDIAAFFRAIDISVTETGGILGTKIDSNRIHFMGQSLGSILGTVAMAVESWPQKAALVVPGLRLPSIFAESSNSKLMNTYDKVLSDRGIAKGSAGELQLVHVFQWVIDPSDPGNFAGHLVENPLPDWLNVDNETSKPLPLPIKQILQIRAGKDDTIAPHLQSQLASLIKGNSEKTYYPDENHSFVIEEKAATTPNARKAALAQIIHFFKSAEGAVCTPNVTAGTCN